MNAASNKPSTLSLGWLEIQLIIIISTDLMSLEWLAQIRTNLLWNQALDEQEVLHLMLFALYYRNPLEPDSIVGVMAVSSIYTVIAPAHLLPLDYPSSH